MNFAVYETENRASTAWAYSGRRRVGVGTDQEMPPETRRNHVGSSIIEGPWPAVTSGFLVGETPKLQLGTSMLSSDSHTKQSDGKQDESMPC
jgi:hypothetical protein